MHQLLYVFYCFLFPMGFVLFLPVLIDSMLFFGKKYVILKKNFFVVNIKINSTFLFGMKAYWYKNRMGEFKLLNFRPIFLYAFKVRPLKNVKNKFKALLSYEVVFLRLFKL